MIQKAGTKIADSFFGVIGLGVVISILGLNAYLIFRYLL
jgi:hypothetical protein